MYARLVDYGSKRSRPPYSKTTWFREGFWYTDYATCIDFEPSLELDVAGIYANPERTL